MMFTACLTLTCLLPCMQAGTKFLVKYFAQPDLKHLDIRADYDDSVPVPDTHGKPVPAKYRDFVTYFPNWVTMPDFYRVSAPTAGPLLRH